MLPDSFIAVEADFGLYNPAYWWVAFMNHRVNMAAQTLDHANRAHSNFFWALLDCFYASGRNHFHCAICLVNNRYASLCLRVVGYLRCLRYGLVSVYASAILHIKKVHFLGLISISVNLTIAHLERGHSVIPTMLAQERPLFKSPLQADCVQENLFCGCVRGNEMDFCRNVWHVWLDEANKTKTCSLLRLVDEMYHVARSIFWQVTKHDLLRPLFINNCSYWVVKCHCPTTLRAFVDFLSFNFQVLIIITVFEIDLFK